jgi:hypothetical protein
MISSVIFFTLFSDFINVIGNRLIAESGDSNQRNYFSIGFPLLFNVETLQAFGADSALLSEKK